MNLIPTLSRDYAGAPFPALAGCLLLALGCLTAPVAGAAQANAAEDHDHDHHHDHEFDQRGAHEHGKVRLNVALDGNDLLIEMDAPADNVIGFEHAPKTDAQKATLRDKSAWLNAGTNLFTFPAAAACRFQRTELTAPQFSATGHAEFHARFAYHCGKPAELAWVQPTLLGGLQRLQEAEVVVLTPTRQGSERVTTGTARVRLR